MNGIAIIRLRICRSPRNKQTQPIRETGFIQEKSRNWKDKQDVFLTSIGDLSLTTTAWLISDPFTTCSTCSLCIAPQLISRLACIMDSAALVVLVLGRSNLGTWHRGRGLTLL